MHKRIKRVLRCCVIFTLFCAVLPSFAGQTAYAADYREVPYDTYNYWEPNGTKKAVYSRPMFEPAGAITADTLGVAPFSSKMSDVHSSPDGKTYLLDGGGSRLCVLDREYKLIKEITAIDKKGESLRFAGAAGVFAKGDGKIYIADTENARVLIADENGAFLDEITLPQSDLIPEGFQFRPAKLTVDSRGYVYVVSDGSFYGALLFSPKKAFQGFFGANRVGVTIGSFFSAIWKRRFESNEKLALTRNTVPYQFSDITCDGDNMIYTCTGATDHFTNGTAQIKKLSPGGLDVLDTENFSFTDEGYSMDKNERRIQDLLSVSVDENGFVYTLDSKYGRVFVYDQEQAAITTLGGGAGAGDQLGTFRMARAMTIGDGNVLVLDILKKSVTVFCVNNYGRLAMDSQSKTYRGEYLAAKPGWQEVLRLDRHNQKAYQGLAQASLLEQDYSEAMRYAKLGYSYNIYDQAFEHVRRDFILSNFPLLFGAALLLIGGAVFLMVYTQRRKTVLIGHEPTRLMLSTLTHPFRSFQAIKDKNKGSVWLSALLLALFALCSILKITASGYPYSKFDPATFNSLMVVVRTSGLLLLWVVVNWAVCTLFEGKGRMKEILVVSAYSLIPLIIESVVFILLSHVMLSGEGQTLTSLQSVAGLYFLIVLAVGTMTIHEFSLKKFVGTGIVSLLGMAVAVFVFFMLGILLQQFWAFLVTVFSEVIYR